MGHFVTKWATTSSLKRILFQEVSLLKHWPKKWHEHINKPFYCHYNFISFPSTQNLYQIYNSISAVDTSIYVYNEQGKFLLWGKTNTLEMQYTFLHPSLGRNNINSEAIFSLHYRSKLCTQSIIVSDQISCWKKTYASQRWILLTALKNATIK